MPQFNRSDADVHTFIHYKKAAPGLMWPWRGLGGIDLRYNYALKLKQYTYSLLMIFCLTLVEFAGK